jgi:hypothetical protein
MTEDSFKFLVMSFECEGKSKKEKGRQKTGDRMQNAEQKTRDSRNKRDSERA